MDIRRITYDQWIDYEQRDPITLLIQLLTEKIRTIKPITTAISLISDTYNPLYQANEIHNKVINESVSELEDYLFKIDNISSTVYTEISSDNTTYKKVLF